MKRAIAAALLGLPLLISALAAKPAAAESHAPIVVAQRDYNGRRTETRREEIRRAEIRREEARRAEIRREEARRAEIRREEARRAEIRRREEARRYQGRRVLVDGHWVYRR